MIIENLLGGYLYIGGIAIAPGETEEISDELYAKNDILAGVINSAYVAGSIDVTSPPSGFPRGDEHTGEISGGGLTELEIQTLIDASIGTHTSDSTSVHAISDTSALITQTDLDTAIAFVGVKANRTSAFTVSTGNFPGVAVTLDSAESWDTNTFHDGATNPSRITIPTGLNGKYDIKAHAEWDSNTTGERAIFIVLNGTGRIVGQRVLATGNQQISCSVDYNLAVADFIELVCYQTSGSNRTVVNCWVSLRRIEP